MNNEKSISFGKNGLFEVDIESLIPDELDNKNYNEKDKSFYVKVNCKNKEEVRNIIKVFEKLNIENERIVISV